MTEAQYHDVQNQAFWDIKAANVGTSDYTINIYMDQCEAWGKEASVAGFTEWVVAYYGRRETAYRG